MRVRSTVTVSLLAGLMSITTLAGDGKRPVPPKQAPRGALGDPLPPPDYLSPLARQMLRRRMERHGRDTAVLFQAALTLQRGTVKTLAQDIANEPRIVRPLPGAQDDLNAALPERFFALQDELRDRARDLARAAETADDGHLGKRLGALVETCVACHAAYLTGDKAP